MSRACLRKDAAKKKTSSRRYYFVGRLFAQSRDSGILPLKSMCNLQTIFQCAKNVVLQNECICVAIFYCVHGSGKSWSQKSHGSITQSFRKQEDGRAKRTKWETARNHDGWLTRPSCGGLRSLRARRLFTWNWSLFRPRPSRSTWQLV